MREIDREAKITDASISAMLLFGVSVPARGFSADMSFKGKNEAIYDGNDI